MYLLTSVVFQINSKNRLYPDIRVYEHVSLFSFEELTLLVCPYIFGTPCVYE